MTAFIVGAALLLALAGWMLRPAARTAPAATGRSAASVDILGAQLAALDREHASGALDAAEHRAARLELQRRLLDDTAGVDPAIRAVGLGKRAWALGTAIPLFAFALYAAIGNPAGLDARPAAPMATAPEPEVSPEAVQAMLATLAQRLEQPSGDAATDRQGWTMLARSYAGLQRFADADRAYARAIALAPSPGDAQLLADRADVLAVLQDRRTAGEPERLIAQALAIDPRHPKALALAGSAAFERQDHAEAARLWQAARDGAPAGSAFAAGLDRSLAEVGAATPAPAAARITGRVSLAPALAARAAPTDIVFVFARAAEGSRMPLAVVRRSVADLPFDFTLDDSLAMSPQAKLSGATRVIVGARLSRSGNAMPQAGDLQGETAAIGTSSEGVRVVIDRVRP